MSSPRFPEPKNYNRDARRLGVAITEWIAIQSETRSPDLRFHEWGTVCYIGPLRGEALDHLAASPDARAMLEWADERIGRQGTLLMACAVLEIMGLKSPHRRPSRTAN
jgi:hypothetical protein